MKRTVFSVMLVMAFCVSGMRAQNVENADSIDIDVTADEVVTDNTKDDMSSKYSRPKTDNFDQAEVILNKFQTLLDANQKDADENESPILVPIGKKKKWFMTQRLGISILGGSDKDGDKEADDQNSNNDNEKSDNPVNIGLNADYTLIFARGHIKDDKVQINPLGFALGAGLLAAFDKQDQYGMTCDIMLKLGVETGFGHKMGFGLDFLYGTGKSSGTFYYFDAPDEAEAQDNDFWSEPYTAWCEKIGGQISLRSGLVRTNTGNGDIRFFVRYVYSINPNKSSELSKYLLYREWYEESWQIGITYCYCF